MLKPVEKLLGKRKKIFTKFLFIIVMVSIVMLTIIPLGWQNAEEPVYNAPKTFMNLAEANHWGRSDLRSYLNGITKEDNTLLVDSTHDKRQISGWYESQFSDAEYDLVQPFMYSTNVFDSSGTKIDVYTTKDKFWLPSGNFMGQVSSWGTEDISDDTQYDKAKSNSKSYLIPISYWSYSYVRSPRFNLSGSAYESVRGDCIDVEDVDMGSDVAATFKINLSSVNFASVASAASISATGEAKKIKIDGTSKIDTNYATFGERSTKELPEYGMYLKTKADESVQFNPDSLIFGKDEEGHTKLTINYTGGVPDQYVIVQAFKSDDLANGITSYMAAQKIIETGEGKSATIAVYDWEMSSLDGYTIKVWMEDPSNGSSLAKATMPVTFVGTDKTETGASTNLRIFSMKNELKTSWGDLSTLSDEDYNRVLSGENTSANGWIMGNNPSNQKIYFGSYNDSPLEFWIAGRETAVNDGEKSDSGGIMTLYQAKTVETKKFNASTNSYKENPSLELQDNESVAYTGSTVKYLGNVTYQNAQKIDLEIPSNNPTYQYSTDNGTDWNDGMPTNVGLYKIRAKVIANGAYESSTSMPVNFTIAKTEPTANDFIFAGPNDLIYDGKAKSATVTSKKQGMGLITIKYYDSSGTQLNIEPTNIGVYTVKINVAEGALYYSATDLTNEEWKFTIEADKTSWGTPEDHIGITHYTNSEGVTSVNIAENGIIWLRKEFYEEDLGSSTVAWYGLDNSSGIFEIGSRFYVQWFNEKEHSAEFKNIDENIRSEVNNNKGWLFRAGVIKPDGTLYEESFKDIGLYVQIGNDWDKNNLRAYYVQQGKDEAISVKCDTIAYPEGTDEFGIMTLSHFSPSYFIYDKLTDEEKNAFDALSGEGGNKSDTTKTGDAITYITILILVFIMILSLGLMLKTKRKNKNS